MGLSYWSGSEVKDMNDEISYIEHPALDDYAVLFRKEFLARCIKARMTQDEIEREWRREEQTGE